MNDIYAEASELLEKMVHAHPECSLVIKDATAYSATGTEALMALRWVLKKYKNESSLAEFQQQNSKYS